MRPVLPVLALLLGCTADFFVGQEPSDTEATSSGTAAATMTDVDTSGAPASETSPMSADATETTSGLVDATTSSSSSSTTNPIEASSDSDDGDSTSASTTETRETGEEDPCAVFEEKACIAEAPECTWTERACITDTCADEAECGELGEAACLGAEMCFWLGPRSCFFTACVPCNEIESMAACMELPNCEWVEDLCVS
ncbi:MAG: hypothetical protein JKY37_09840 [Nannocystaceae bacterium]|nr:hypothetical protein [Nannocystaceae bacterium]